MSQPRSFQLSSVLQLSSLMDLVERNDAFLHFPSSNSVTLHLGATNVQLHHAPHSTRHLLLTDRARFWNVHGMTLGSSWPPTNANGQHHGECPRDEFEHAYGMYVDSYTQLYALVSQKETLQRLKNRLLDAPPGGISEHETLDEIQDLLGDRDPAQMIAALANAQATLHRTRDVLCQPENKPK